MERAVSIPKLNPHYIGNTGVTLTEGKIQLSIGVQVVDNACATCTPNSINAEGVFDLRLERTVPITKKNVVTWQHTCGAARIPLVQEKKIQFAIAVEVCRGRDGFGGTDGLSHNWRLECAVTVAKENRNSAVVAIADREVGVTVAVEVVCYKGVWAGTDGIGDRRLECAVTITQKNRDTLFTFLRHDGVPWNNNNAEHAIKAFATLREVIKGVTSESGLRNYLVLLSICETCNYQGLDFLDFLRSGETDIGAFADSRQKRRF